VSFRAVFYRLFTLARPSKNFSINGHDSSVKFSFSGHVLKRIAERLIHVISAYNAENDTEYVITVYEPDVQKWSNNFTERRHDKME